LIESFKQGGEVFHGGDRWAKGKDAANYDRKIIKIRLTSHEHKSYCQLVRKVFASTSSFAVVVSLPPTRSGST
jgi:hypothetical protein